MDRHYSSMDDALLGALGELLLDGRQTRPRDRDTIELLEYSFRLTDPRARRIALPARGWNEALAVGELCWHLSGSDSLEFVSYYAKAWRDFSDDGQHIASSCYGRRIFGGVGKDSQWSRILTLLHSDRESRRAVLSLADPNHVSVRAKDVACVTSIQFLIRDNRLNCITTMRSCDAIWGLCYDVYLFTTIQELLSVQLGVRLGWYSHVAGSFHLYDRFRPMAEEIVRQGRVAIASEMMPIASESGLADLLSTEEGLRLNLPDATEKFHSLPPYWKQFARPLLELSFRRWPRTVSHKPVTTG